MKNSILVQQRFNRFAADYDKAAIITDQAGKVLLSHLAHLSVQPEVILDLGAGTGRYLPALKKRFPRAKIIGIDIAENMLRYAAHQPLACADAVALPVADASVDFIFMNMLLPWCTEPLTLYQEIQRVLKPKGLWLFSTVGPKTLHELKDSWQQVDASPHVNTFTDMHDFGDELRQKFAEVVLEMEQLTIHYRQFSSLLRDLRHLGSMNLEGSSTYITKNSLEAVAQHYQQHYARAGKLPVTIEFIYGHAWQHEIVESSSEVRVSLSKITKS